MAIYQSNAANVAKLRFNGGAAETRSTEAGVRARIRVAMSVAAEHADEVDERAIFPEEAIAATRAQRLLGIMVPKEYGGDGATVSDAADVCYGLGRVCASTAMIYAMHQCNVACLVRHAGKNAWHLRILHRLGTDQILLASSTTEGRGGANIRSSDAALQSDGRRIRLVRQASVVSYGAHADGILTVARRSAEAAGSDQLLVLFLKDDCSLEPVGDWDVLGMRGTCSAGFHLRAQGECDQILPEAYARIHLRTMMPVSHLLWAGVWAGIAAGAVERARLFVRTSARHAEGQLPPAAAHFARATASLQTLRGLLTSSLAR